MTVDLLENFKKKDEKEIMKGYARMLNDVISELKEHSGRSI